MASARDAARGLASRRACARRSADDRSDLIDSAILAPMHRTRSESHSSSQRHSHQSQIIDAPVSYPVAHFYGGRSASVAGDPDIVVIDEVLTRDDTLALLAVTDCVLSLHRCEGLGLMVAEAMALGVPVIATDYAATTELLSERTGYPVSYRLVALKPGEYPMGDGQSWADPDVAHAAWLMQRVMRDPAEVRRRATVAKLHLEANHGRAAVLSHQLARLSELGIR